MSTPRPAPKRAPEPNIIRGDGDAFVHDPVPRATRGAALLDEARNYLAACVIWPSQSYLDMVTLWGAGFTHMRDAQGVLVGQTNPHLFITSDDYGGGKSTALTSVADIAHKAEMVVCPTGPGAVRAVSERSGTYLVDEWDVMMGRGAGAPLFRSVLTGSFMKRTAVTQTAAGDRSVWTPIGLCGRGDKIRVNDELRAVIQRCHVVPMREKRPDEHVQDYDADIHPFIAEKISAALAEWGQRVGPDAARLRPEMPVGVSNRRVDLWRPLLRVADMAGGHWPETARAACRAICLSENDDTTIAQLSAAEQTLVDVSYVFGLSGAESLTTRNLLDLLCERPGGAQWRNYPRDERGNSRAAAMALAADLATFGVERGSGKVTVDGRQLQGYAWASIEPFIPADLPVFVPAARSPERDGDETLDLPFE